MDNLDGPIYDYVLMSRHESHHRTSAGRLGGRLPAGPAGGRLPGEGRSPRRPAARIGGGGVSGGGLEAGGIGW